MPAALTVPNPLPQLPAAVETAAYRITTEAVHNVVKHAKAHSCAVRIDHDGRQLELTVQDDGQGLPPTPTLGLGMASMRERAEELGGTLVGRTARSRPHGTRRPALRRPRGQSRTA